MAANSDEEVMSMFESWMVKHGRSYNGVAEKEKSFEIFKANLRHIKKHNALPDKTCTLGLNDFTDLTSDEFQRRCCGARPCLPDSDAAPAKVQQIC